MASSRKSPERALAQAFECEGLIPEAFRGGQGIRVVVAWSGGLDSTVLLAASVRLLGAQSLCAVHVDHGLQPAARLWPAHCARQAAALGVACRVIKLEERPAPGQSVEAWAREARYRALVRASREIGASCLLTAHHLDDQIESVLLAMARGCGLDGLAALQAAGDREGLRLLRPFLDVTRETLLEYAQTLGLTWVEDPSNADPRFARNALRRTLMPVLKQVLPTLWDRMPDAHAHWVQARTLLNDQAREDLESARCESGLDRRRVAQLPRARQDPVLRAWVAQSGAPAPSTARLKAMHAQLVAGQGPHGRVHHAGWVYARHRDRLFAWSDRDDPGCGVESSTLIWQGEVCLPVPGFGGWLAFEAAQGAQEGLPRSWLIGRPITVCAPCMSMRLRLRAMGPSRSLKNLFQEQGIPPVLRARFPTFSVAGQLVLAAPFGMDRSASGPGAAASAPAPGAAASVPDAAIGPEVSQDPVRVRLVWRLGDGRDPRRHFTGGFREDPHGRPGSPRL